MFRTLAPLFIAHDIIIYSILYILRPYLLSPNSSYGNKNEIYGVRGENVLMHEANDSLHKSVPE